MAKVANVRGLRNYIQELRSCASTELEKERVDKELGKIRKKYTSDKAMSAYDKRKYMWKLLYTHMLGYNVDFGHKQAMDLIAAPGYAEKQVGYVACAVFLSERDEFLRLVINSVRNDLVSRNEAFQCLALDFTANVGGAEFAQLLTSDVMAVLSNGATRPVVRKKAALCLLRLIRKAPPDSEILSPSVWGARLAEMLSDPNVGVLLGLTTLLLGIVARSYAGYESCVPRLVALLERCKARDVPQDYTYYGLASPWLQVKTLRVLQYFPAPEDPVVRASLVDTLRRLLSGSEPVKNINKNNAVHAIVFEAVAVAIALEDAELLTAGVALLARFLAAHEPNLRYLALECLARLASVPAVADAVVRHAGTVKACLVDPDVSIARRALDLLFTVSGPESAADVVETLLAFLPNADYAIREELVLKTAVLAERFLPNLEWYVDAMLRLMLESGEFAVNDLWQSVVQLATNAPELHAYAAKRSLEGLNARESNGQPPEAFLRAATHLLGEFGPLLRPEVQPSEIYNVLVGYFPAAMPDTKGLMLTAFSKLALTAPDDEALQSSVHDLLGRHERVADAELQQRALEYAGLIHVGATSDAARAALQPLPRWERQGSLLLRRLQELEGEGADEEQERPGWMAGEESSGPVPLRSASDVNVVSPLSVCQQQIKAPGTAAPPPEPDLLVLLSDVTTEASNGPEPTEPGSLISPTSTAYSAPNAVSQPEPQQVSPAFLEAWHRKLWTSATGILFEDEALQIGVKSALNGATVTVTLFLGNKTGSTLELNLSIASVPSSLTAVFGSAVPTQIEPRHQVQVPVDVVSRAPGLGSVELRLSYRGISADALPVPAFPPTLFRLPFPPAKFAQPVDVPRDVFSARWTQVVGPPFKVAAPAPPAAASLGSEALEQTLSALHLRVIPGVEAATAAGPRALAAACVLLTQGAEGAPAPRQVPCMVIVAPQGSIAVATADAAASAALLEQVSTVLGWGGAP